MLQAKDFLYPSRTAPSFEKRWKSIEKVLDDEFGPKRPFSLLDLGSGTGYFSLQVATKFQNAQVVAVEGAVGLGNNARDAEVEIAGSSDTLPIISDSHGVVHTAGLISKLKLKNCRVAPEIWDASDIADKVADGFSVGCMLALSVVHDIERISRCVVDDKSCDDAQSELCLDILSNLFLVSSGICIIEMPPAIQYYAADGSNWANVYKKLGSPEKVLIAAGHRAFSKVGSFTVDRIFVDSDYDGRETFVVRGFNAQADFFSGFSALMTKPGEVTFNLYPPCWTGKFDQRGWQYVEVAPASKELNVLNELVSSSVSSKLCTAFRLENKESWERFSKARDAIKTKNKDRVNHNMHAGKKLAKFLNVSEVAGEQLMGHGSRNNQLASIALEGLSTRFSPNIWLANNLQTNKSYVRADHGGQALTAMAAQSQIVAARSSSAAKREHETWTNNVAQLSPNGL